MKSIVGTLFALLGLHLARARQLGQDIVESEDMQKVTREANQAYQDADPSHPTVMAIIDSAAKPTFAKKMLID